MASREKNMTVSVSREPVASRAEFIRKTYAHLAGSIAAFVALEVLLFDSAFAHAMIQFVRVDRYRWLIVIGAFMIVGRVARGFASRVSSIGAQYAGLALFVTAKAIIFIPLLHGAVLLSSPDVLPSAVLLSAILFLGLTTVVFTTRADFSFLRNAILIGGMIALGLIVSSIVFGFRLGLVFSGGIVILAGASILYNTSKMLHRYSTKRHVAAALDLFASVTLLLWGVLRILRRFHRR